MPKEVIPYEKVREIVENCKDRRTRALIAMQYAFNARVGELSMEYRHRYVVGKKNPMIETKVVQGLTVKDFYDNPKYIEVHLPNFKNTRLTRKVVRLTKGGESWLLTPIVEWINSKRGMHVFDIQQCRIRGLIDKELKKYHPAYSTHCLRHSRCTHLHSKFGYSAYEIKESAGHARLETSAQYTRIDPQLMMDKIMVAEMEDEEDV